MYETIIGNIILYSTYKGYLVNGLTTCKTKHMINKVRNFSNQVAKFNQKTCWV